MAFLVLLLLVIGAVALWSLIDPQTAFRATQGVMFRKPSTVRLSGYAATGNRILGALVLVIVIITLVNL